MNPNDNHATEDQKDLAKMVMSKSFFGGLVRFRTMLFPCPSSVFLQVASPLFMSGIAQLAPQLLA